MLGVSRPARVLSRHSKKTPNSWKRSGSIMEGTAIHTHEESSEEEARLTFFE
jgi:hypothetical protein